MSDDSTKVKEEPIKTRNIENESMESDKPLKMNDLLKFFNSFLDGQQISLPMLSQISKYTSSFMYDNIDKAKPSVFLLYFLSLMKRYFSPPQEFISAIEELFSLIDFFPKSNLSDVSDVERKKVQDACEALSKFSHVPLNTMIPPDFQSQSLFERSCQ